MPGTSLRSTHVSLRVPNELLLLAVPRAVERGVSVSRVLVDAIAAAFANQATEPAPAHAETRDSP